MYAIIETGGKQYRVTQGSTVKVDLMEAEAGKELTLKALWSSDGKEEGGARGGTVLATVARHLRASKIIVFHKRPKKGTRKTQGHRQDLTELLVKEIKL